MSLSEEPNQTASGDVLPKNPFKGVFASFAKETLDHWKVPGVSMAFIDGQEIFAEGFGFAVLPDTPATPETLWMGGSTTKAFVGAVLAHLIDTKEFSSLSKGWETTISSIIHDDFVMRDEWATAHLTLEDAVCHRTGMARHDKAFVREMEGRKAEPKDIVRKLRYLTLSAEPRTKFIYTNLMYVALSHVLETISGKWLGDLLKEKIWGPLGMDSTLFDLDDAKKAPETLAQGYYWDEEEERFEPAPDLEVRETSGADAIFSNVLDYAKWLKCLLHEEAPFSKNTHQDIKRPRIFGAMPMMGKDVTLYGLGWQRSTYKGHIVYEHAGGVLAYGSQVYWFPDDDFAVVAFGNTSMTSNAAVDILAWRLIDDKLGVPEVERGDKGAFWSMIINAGKGGKANAIERLYPDRPDPPLPPTLRTAQLVGTYHNPGYGTITLQEEPHPNKAEEKVLVAYRPEMTWNYKMELHHVSGDRYICYDEHLAVKDFALNDFSKSEFRIGADGKASYLEIHMESHLGPPEDMGIVSFKRTSPEDVGGKEETWTR